MHHSLQKPRVRGQTPRNIHGLHIRSSSFFNVSIYLTPLLCRRRGSAEWPLSCGNAAQIMEGSLADLLRGEVISFFTDSVDMSNSSSSLSTEERHCNTPGSVSTIGEKGDTTKTHQQRNWSDFMGNIGCRDPLLLMHRSVKGLIARTTRSPPALYLHKLVFSPTHPHAGKTGLTQAVHIQLPL